MTNLLTELKWAELKTRRKDIRLSFLYKIINSKVEICLSDLDTYIVDRTTRRGASSGSTFNQKLFLPRAKTAVRRHSFIIRSVPEWNTLPLDTLQSSSMLLRASWTPDSARRPLNYLRDVSLDALQINPSDSDSERKS